jgi:acyl carrier protein
MRTNLIIWAMLIASIFSAACSRGSQISEIKQPNATPAPSFEKDALRGKVEEKLNEMFVAQFQVDRNGIRPDARLVEDLKGDELDFVEMILRVEEGFDITIPDADASKLTRVRDFYDYVEKRLR